MAVLQRIREFFVPPSAFMPEVIVPAPPTTYIIRLLTEKHLKEVLQLNLRCFKAGENYTKHTFSYLLNQPNSLSYRIVTPNQNIIGFIFVMVNTKDGTGHITTIGIAPEHRRRGLAIRLLRHAEEALKKRDIGILMLEVRVSNVVAQNLYRNYGYSVVQKLLKYYHNGEDGFLMVKSLN